MQEVLAGGSAEHLRLSHAARETGVLLERARGALTPRPGTAPMNPRRVSRGAA